MGFRDRAAPEPQDAVPAWYGADSVRDETIRSSPYAAYFEYEALLVQQASERVLRADPAHAARQELAKSECAGDKQQRAVHAQRATAWATLALYEELRAQGAAGRVILDTVPDNEDERNGS